MAMTRTIPKSFPGPLRVTKDTHQVLSPFRFFTQTLAVTGQDGLGGLSSGVFIEPPFRSEMLSEGACLSTCTGAGYEKTVEVWRNPTMDLDGDRIGTVCDLVVSVTTYGPYP